MTRTSAHSAAILAGLLTLVVPLAGQNAGTPSGMFGGPAPGPGRPAAEQFVASVNRIEQMQEGVQVRVVSHPWMDPDFWVRADRLAGRRPGDPHPFVTPDLFRAWVAD